MHRARLITLFWFASALALAQREMTVAQLVTFIKSSIQLHNPDKDVADTVARIKVTNKLEDRVVEELQGAGAGPKTIADIWELIPFENYLVTAQLAPDEIKTVMEEVYASREPRNLIGFEIETEGVGYERRITAMRLADGRGLERDKRYSIAFNSFDSRSGGHRFMKLRALLETPATRCIFHPIQTRDAMIEYFRRHEVVHRIASRTRVAA